MATTQYTGARYVPLFADPIEWSSDLAYEPLTIVMHEGNSYTSRQFVPKGIDVDNNRFWAKTGNYNAQVEKYRQEVNQLSNHINVKNYVYNTVSDASSSPAKPGDIIITLGYYTVADGGGGVYIVIDELKNTPDCIVCGIYAAKLVVYETVNILSLGVKNNSDATKTLQYALENFNKIELAPITVTLSAKLDVPSNKTVIGNGTIMLTNSPIIVHSNTTIKDLSIKGKTTGLLFDNLPNSSRNNVVKDVHISNCEIAVQLLKSWVNTFDNVGISECDTAYSFDGSSEVNAINILNSNVEYKVKKFIDARTVFNGINISNCCIEGLEDAVLTTNPDVTPINPNSLFIKGSYFENPAKSNKYPKFCVNNQPLIIGLSNTKNVYNNTIENADIMGDGYPAFNMSLINDIAPTSVPLYGDIGMVSYEMPMFTNYTNVLNIPSLTFTHDGSVFTADEFPNMFFGFYDANGIIHDDRPLNALTQIHIYITSPVPDYLNVCFDILFNDAATETHGVRGAYFPNVLGKQSTPRARPELGEFNTRLRKQYCYTAKRVEGTQSTKKYQMHISYGSNSVSTFSVKNVAFGW